ncbi:MAG: type II toxin-antitoxin system PemK/MazF family toxin [Chloroflexi bacterium]|nr:type II toxin-antitoxin system PemK/MazF family toxin [Chloroflexota bacterium]
MAPGGVISQGDIYWIDDGEPVGSEPGYRRPYVVVQNNVLNASRIGTVVMVPLTTNLRHASLVGNVLLRKSDGGLSRDSVAVAAQVECLNRDELGEYIGRLQPHRVREIIAGLSSIFEPREPPRP